MPDKRPLTSEDLFKFQMIDDPQISPDGRYLAFVKTWLDATENSYRSNIYVMSLASGETRQLSHGNKQDTYPRWSPDGRFIAYLAGIQVAPQEVATAETFLGKLAQLHVIPAEGGEASKLTNLAGGVQGHSWSPDGSTIAFTTLVNPERGLESAELAGKDDLYEKYNQDVLVANRVRWKSDALGFVGDYYRHIAKLDFDGDNPGATQPILLTSGSSDFSSPTWSPNGKHLAVAGNLQPEAEWQRKSYVYLLDAAADAPTEPQEICGLEEMRSGDLAFSPDGSTLAVCGHDDPIKGHYGLQKLWLINVANGSKECVSEHIDMSFGDFSRNQDMRRYGGDDGPRWAADGKSLLLLTNEEGTVNLASFSLESKELSPLTEGNHAVFAFSADTSQETVVTLITSDTNPCDLFQVITKDGSHSLKRLTNINKDFFDEITLSVPEKFQSHSSGVTVDGWVYPPVGLEAGKKYPVILYTGGGPGGMRASVFCHEWQLYANQGYTVINCNARGNYGYGEAFSAATRGKWGDLDYEDNMAYINDALEHYDYMDSERLAVAGGSYGGYMAAWITSRQDKFKASVVDRSLFNRHAFHLTGDIGFLLDKIEFEGRLPWDDAQVFLERSPSHYIAGNKTPTLVVHSEQDHRCPVGNGEQLYMSLKRLGVPTKLVRFPNETHELSRGGRPWHRVFRLDSYLDWFEQYI